MKNKKKISASSFFNSYINSLNIALKNIDLRRLQKAINLILLTIKKKKKIIVCGNGGSAAIANHYVCDYLKFLREHTNFKPKVVSLSSNIETITAIANDMSYNDIFKYQAESICESGDIIILISSSGNSKNIINLIKFAKIKKIKTIGFCGFKGGYLKKNSTVPIHVKANNYGLSEDSHHILMHAIMQYLIKSTNI